MSSTFGGAAGTGPARTTAVKVARTVQILIIASLASYVPVLANVAAFSVIEPLLAFEPDHFGGTEIQNQRPAMAVGRVATAVVVSIPSVSPVGGAVTATASEPLTRLLIRAATTN
jgi:hypothetical protein